MTSDQHRRVGAILGYPECCVEAWIDGPRSHGYGDAVTVRNRTPVEAAILDDTVSALLGRPWRGASSDLRVRYIRCRRCAER